MGCEVGCEKAHETKLMTAGIGEGGQHLPWAAVQQQGAALHGEARIATGLRAEDDRRASHHPRAEEVAGIAFDQDDAASLAVARPLPGMAAQQNEAAGHAAPLAGQSTAQPVSGIARDFEDAALHGSAGEGPGMAADGQLPTRHGKPRIGAGIAFDRDLSGGHLAPDMVELCGPAADDEASALARCEIEDLVDTETPIAAGKLDGADPLEVQAGQPFRQERGEIEPLARRPRDGESDAAHAISSRRWNLYWPSLPP